MTDETRRVVVLKDPCAPLWYLRCAEPCGVRPGRDWCMTGQHSAGGDLIHPPHCYLGGADSAGAAGAMARRLGYALAEAGAAI